MAKGGHDLNGIKEARKKRGLTQIEMAKMMGEKQSTISMWETGSNIPRASKLPQIAKILGCTVDELFEKQE